MSRFKRVTSMQRVVLVMVSITLAFGAGSAFVAYGTGGPTGTTIYGCLTKGATLHSISVGTPVECKPSDTPINWISYAPMALDATYVNEGQADSITSGMLADGDVGESDLGSDSVTSAKIVDGSITKDDLGTGSVGTDELAPDSVISDRIVNGSVLLEDLALNSVDTNQIIDGGVWTTDLTDGAVNADKIDPNSVQRRVTGTCSAGMTVSAVNADGSVTCAAAGASVIRIMGEMRTVWVASSTTDYISCPAGYTLTGGGVLTYDGDMKVRESGPASPTTWWAAVRNDHVFSSGKMQTHALCIRTQ